MHQPNEGIDSVIWRIAAFLAWHQQDDVWRILENAQQTGAQLPPLATRLDYLAQMMRGKGYLLCIDDLHHVEGDPSAAEPIVKVTEMLQSGDIFMIITSRRMPAFAEWSPANQLDGLTLDDTASLLNARGIELANDYVRQLHENTGGNAQFLNLSIQALRKTRNPQRLVNNLLDADDLERYLLNEVNRQLGEDEQAVMNACAAMMGYPATREAIEATLDGQRIRSPLRSLTDAHLLNVSEGAEVRTYHLHAIVGDFYYEGLSRKEREGLHQRAGHFYEGAEDVFKAALHYEQAGEVEKAALLATDVQLLLSSGFMRPLRQLLERVRNRSLQPKTHVAVDIALGHIDLRYGDNKTAQARFEEALARSESLEKAEILKALSCYGLCRVYEERSFEEALAWIQRGLNHLDSYDPVLEALLYIHAAGIRTVLGNFEESELSLELGMQRVPLEPHILHIVAYENASALYFYQGKISQAIQACRDGLAICEQLGNTYKAIGLLNNLGGCSLIDGDWDHAYISFEKGLNAANRLGAEKQCNVFRLNLGILRMWQGDHHEAEAYLQAIMDGVDEFAINARYSLAELRIRQANHHEALALLKEAETQVKKLGTNLQLSELYSLRAQAELATGQIEQANQYVAEALAVASELKMSREEGIAHRVDGEIKVTAQADYQAANDSFQQSVAALVNTPYEIARTKLAWGSSYLSQEQPRDAEILLKDALKTFVELGAKHDLKIASNLLDSLTNSV